MAKVKQPDWRNRIVGYGMEDADQLLANPANWRIHPKHQQDALSGVLNEIGWVQNILVNKTTGHVVDGHLRAALAITAGKAANQRPFDHIVPWQWGGSHELDNLQALCVRCHAIKGQSGG